MNSLVGSTNSELYKDIEQPPLYENTIKHVTKENIGSISFLFSEVRDITNFLYRSNDLNSSTSYIGVRAISASYPDNTVTDKVLLADCFIQHDKFTQTTITSAYGFDYITIGIPALYIDRIITSGKDSEIDCLFKGNIVENYCWTNVSLDECKDNILLAKHDKEHQKWSGTLVNIQDVLRYNKQDLNCSVIVRISLISKNGISSLSFKLYKIILQDINSI